MVRRVMSMVVMGSYSSKGGSGDDGIVATRCSLLGAWTVAIDGRYSQLFYHATGIRGNGSNGAERRKNSTNTNKANPRPKTAGVTSARATLLWCTYCI